MSTVTSSPSAVVPEIFIGSMASRVSCVTGLASLAPGIPNPHTPSVSWRYPSSSTQLQPARNVMAGASASFSIPPFVSVPLPVSASTSVSVPPSVSSSESVSFPVSESASTPPSSLLPVPSVPSVVPFSGAAGSVSSTAIPASSERSALLFSSDPAPLYSLSASTPIVSSFASASVLIEVSARTTASRIDKMRPLPFFILFTPLQM